MPDGQFSNSELLGSVEEKVIAPEIPREAWQTMIFWQRHGRYDSGRPADWANPTEEERRFGRLTEQGRQEVIDRTRDRLQVILETDPGSIDFLFVNSPTFWLDRPELGQRAQETAELIAQTVAEELEQRGLTRDQVLNLNEERNLKGEASRPHENIGEGLMFQVPEFAAFMRKEYKGQGPAFWRAFNRDEQREVREEMGAEGPAEAAQRLHEVARAEARYASLYAVSHPGRHLLIWNITHGDGLEPYVQRVLGVPEDDFDAGYNDGVAMIIENSGTENVGVATVKGKKYTAKMGRLEPEFENKYQPEEPQRD